jgi:hypothetical protein
MSMEEEHLQDLLTEYTLHEYLHEKNRIYIQKQDQNKFKVVYNPVTATTVTYMWTKEQILQNLDFIDKVIDNLKDKEYHDVKSDTEEDGFLITSPFKKNKNKHKNKHKSPKKSPKKHKKSPKKRSKLPKKTPKKSLKRVQKKH